MPTKDAVIHVRIDPELKAAAERVYESMGTSLSEAIRMFATESVKLNGLPFTPTSDALRGSLKAKGALSAYAHGEMRAQEREAWIRSLSEKYATANR